MKINTRPVSAIHTTVWLAPVIALLIAGCNSSTVTTNPTPIKCAVTLTAPQNALEAGPGTGAITVTTAAECAWTASEDASWITGLTPASGQGSGEVRFETLANPLPSTRQADVTINGIAARISQAGTACTLELSPSSQTVAATGGSGTVGVTTPSGCAWTATSGAPWLTITSGGSGNANGTVAFTAAANTGAARIGTLTIGGQAFAVTQPAPTAVPCVNTIQPNAQSMGAAGGTTNVTIQADPSCSWTAASNAAWLAVVGIGTGSGNGAVTISASANTGAARTGTLTIAGQTFTVTQAGSCATSLNPGNRVVATAGATGLSIAVTTATGCAWTATTSDTWITITAGSSGDGNGSVTYSVAANAGPARTGTITIAGQTHTVDQAASCTFSINPTSQSAPAGGGAGTPVAVTANAGCVWTAATTETWITITAGASGSGNGSVSFTTAPNTGSARAGTITIGGQTFTVNQAGSCASSLDPTSQAVPAGGVAGASVAVTSPSGCAWTATTVATWISITAGATGTGNGTVEFTAAANTGPLRTGTITIAGQTHTVTQASGCVFSINPTTLSFNKNAATSAPIAVTAGAGCTWTATANDPWITVQTGATGSGNGSVTFSITANNGPTSRTGTLTIAGRTFTVNQNN